MRRPISLEASVACANFTMLGAGLRHLRGAHVGYLHLDENA
ncbi:MAG TPA: hypothetical protein VIY53_15475 [Acidobacteriaceae bacterium]